MVLLLLVDLDAGLAALGPLGGFFALRTGEPPHGPLPTLAQAYARTPPGPGRPHPVDVRVRGVAEGIGTGEPRVAASVAHQALAARLWSAALGCAVLYGRIPDLDARLFRWDPVGGAPEDLWLTEVRERPADAATLADAVLYGHLEPLAAALRARHRLATGLLRGNAASALAGAARQLDRWARDHGDHQAGDRARDLAARLLAHPLLAGTGTLGESAARTGRTGRTTENETGSATENETGGGTGTVTGTSTGATFRRRSCCLYYRVPGGGVCGDCCFARAPRSSPRAPSG
ncbi:(2Fe-2S)-binding protein [Streptomyces sp. NPDC018610]|uniref:(2Fe-2S)-binding protein n=1 Tax=Streptomyces sp. NPDC018610 TaxID=3365049 RepID=UPI0037A6C38E